MKRFIPLFLLLQLHTAIATAAETAPDFSLPAMNEQVSLESLHGKVVYVDFWASWCIPCRKSFPWMNQIQQRYADKGLTIVAINLDKDADEVKHFLERYPANFIIAYDPMGATASAYKVKGMPSSYLIDRQGRVQYSHIGFREVSKVDLESRIKSLLSE